MGGRIRVTFLVPEAIARGLELGTLERIGGVVRDVSTKRVIHWLKERERPEPSQTLAARFAPPPMQEVPWVQRLVLDWYSSLRDDSHDLGNGVSLRREGEEGWDYEDDGLEHYHSAWWLRVRMPLVKQEVPSKELGVDLREQVAQDTIDASFLALYLTMPTGARPGWYGSRALPEHWPGAFMDTLHPFSDGDLPRLRNVSKAVWMVRGLSGWRTRWLGSDSELHVRRLQEQSKRTHAADQWNTLFGYVEEVTEKRLTAADRADIKAFLLGQQNAHGEALAQNLVGTADPKLLLRKAFDRLTDYDVHGHASVLRLLEQERRKWIHAGSRIGRALYCSIRDGGFPITRLSFRCAWSWRPSS